MKNVKISQFKNSIGQAELKKNEINNFLGSIRGGTDGTTYVSSGMTSGSNACDGT